MIIMYLYKCAQFLKQSNYFDKDKEKTTVESSTSSFMLLRSSGKYESRNDVKLEVVNSVLVLCIYLSICLSVCLSICLYFYTNFVCHIQKCQNIQTYQEILIILTTESCLYKLEICLLVEM